MSRIYISPGFVLLIILFALSCKERTGTYVERKPAAKYEHFLERAVQLTDSGHTYKAFAYLDSAYRQAGDASAIDNFFRYIFLFNTYHVNLKDQETASLYADTLLELAEREKTDGYISAIANYAKGDVLFAQGLYEEAYEYIYKAKTLVRNDLDSCGISDYNYRLGMVLYKQKRYLQATEYFKLAFQESSACPNQFLFFYRKQELLDNIALCYLKLGETDSALDYFRKTLAYIDDHRTAFPEKSSIVFETAEAVVYGNMADAYRNAGMTDTAEELYKKSITINTRVYHDNIDAQYTRIKLAALYMKVSEVEKAKGLLDEIKMILDTLPENNIRRSWNDLMWQYYNKQKKSNIAFNYLLNYKNLNDSITNFNREFIETDVNERFKNRDKEYQLEILQKNNELKQRYLIMMVIGGLLSTVILALLFNNWRKSRKNIRVLKALNNQINDQNKKLESLLSELQFSNNEKDRILRVVAHDIRNPIAAIASLTDLMLADRSQYNADQVEFLELITEACTNALTLTKDLLDVSTPGQGDIGKEMVDVNSLLSNCLSLLRFKGGEKNQTIILHQLDEPASIYVNKEKIWRVINNLVVNAIKFSNNESLIEVAADRTEDSVIISVKDNGMGIPEKYKSRIFDMFTEAKRLGTAGEKSYGLGLSICKQIVEAHGGHIHFESQEGEGTTFYVALPLSKET